MGRSKLTPENIKFIKNNRLKMSGSSMAKVFGVSKDIVNNYMRKNGLSVSKELQIKFRVQGMVGKTTSTPEIDRIIKKDYLQVPVKQLARTIGKSQTFLKTRLRQLGLAIPREIIDMRKYDSQIKKGNTPLNKGKKMPPEVYEKTKATMYKKGHQPHNTREKDGVITVRRDTTSKRQYKYIRISLGKWVPLHQHNWVKKNGAYNTRKYCLWFKDGNSLNCKPNNLELITRKENRYRNKTKFHHYPEDLQKQIKAINKLKKTIKECETK